MFNFTTDPENPEAHILKENDPQKDDSATYWPASVPVMPGPMIWSESILSPPIIEDPFWKQGRDRLTLMGLACNQPCSTCFCTSVGGGPFDTAGLDLLMTDLGESYLIQSCTEKGEGLLKTSPGKPATEKEQKQAAQIKKQAEEAISSKVPTERLKDQPLLDLFNAPFWDEVQFACINCGTCTYLCPTCWCFDIQDEVQGTEGIRMRNWDSCMFPLFTLHGIGP